jgi:hypothetical protein
MSPSCLPDSVAADFRDVLLVDGADAIPDKAGSSTKKVRQHLRSYVLDMQGVVDY